VRYAPSCAGVHAFGFGGHVAASAAAAGSVPPAEHGRERVHALRPTGHAVRIADMAYAAAAALTCGRRRERTAPSIERGKRRVIGGEVEALARAVPGGAGARGHVEVAVARGGRI
jgi:hypothetical protein